MRQAGKPGSEIHDHGTNECRRQTKISCGLLFYLSVINVDGSGSITGRRADRHVGFDHLSMAAVVFLDAQNMILHSFCEIEIFPKSRQFQNVVDEISFGDGDTILAVVINSLDVIEVRVCPVDVFVGEIQRDSPRINDFVEDETRSLGAVQ